MIDLQKSAGIADRADWENVQVSASSSHGRVTIFEMSRYGRCVRGAVKVPPRPAGRIRAAERGADCGGGRLCTGAASPGCDMTCTWTSPSVPWTYTYDRADWALPCLRDTVSAPSLYVAAAAARLAVTLAVHLALPTRQSFYSARADR